MNKLGFIGCGAVVSDMYARNLRGMRSVSICAVSDLDPGRAAAVARELHSRAASMEEVIDQSDLVVVATPPEPHFVIASKALSYGKNVLIEKPFVTRYADGVELVQTAERCGAKLVVGQFRRFYPCVGKSRALIRSGVLGGVKRIECYEGGKFSWNARSSYLTRNQFGGVLYDTGAHTIDMALYAAGIEEYQLDTVVVTRVERDQREPSHEIDTDISIGAQSGKDPISVRVMLSRRRLLSNLIRIVLERAVIEIPLSPSGAARLRAKGECIQLPSGEVMPDAHGAFGKMLLAVLDDSEAVNVIEARTVLNTVRVLESVFLQQ